MTSRYFTKITAYLNNITFFFRNYDDCRDRFWLCPENKRGFVMGTSLNGLGKKICRVDMLRDDEVIVLFTELGKLA